MNITENKLRRIIKEELKSLMEDVYDIRKFGNLQRGTKYQPGEPISREAIPYLNNAANDYMTRVMGKRPDNKILSKNDPVSNYSLEYLGPGYSDRESEYYITFYSVEDGIVVTYTYDSGYGDPETKGALLPVKVSEINNTASQQLTRLIKTMSSSMDLF